MIILTSRSLFLQKIYLKFKAQNLKFSAFALRNLKIFNPQSKKQDRTHRQFFDLL